MVSNDVIIEKSSFEQILPVWRDELWPGRKSAIAPMSAMLYLGGYDSSVHKRFAPVFYAARAGGEIIGVNSGHPSSETDFRSRGLFVAPEFRGRGVGTALLVAIIHHAKEHSFEMVWSAPRRQTLSCYERAGFEKTSDWLTEGFEFGPNCYVRHNIS